MGGRVMIGRIGVVLFFLMAGYLTVTSRENRNIKQYLFNRFVRLYPVYWFLMFLFIFVGGMIPFWQILVNMTMLAEFLRSFAKPVIPSTWMMPMMLTFFVMIAFTGVKFFTRSRTRALMTLIFIMTLALIAGYIRFRIGRRIPTAFFFLTAVAFIGMYYYEMTHSGTITPLTFLYALIIFEVFFVISVYLSYYVPLPGASRPIAYITSYNFGLFIFFVMAKLKFSFYPLSKLGDISFIIFLSMDVLYGFMVKYFPAEILNYNPYVNFLIRFSLVAIFSYLVTKFVERPLIKYSKSIESKLA